MLHDLFIQWPVSQKQILNIDIVSFQYSIDVTSDRVFHLYILPSSSFIADRISQYTHKISIHLCSRQYIYTQCVDILLLSDQFIGHSMDNHKSRTRGSSHARQNQNKHRSCISLSTLHQYGSSYMQIYCFMRRQHCRP